LYSNACNSREDLKKEWMEKQVSIKEEEIRITYSYWDGSGHRRDIVVKKGFSVQLFLTKCLEQLRKEFPELKAVSVDKLMYIKEDLIIPHHNTFYDFIVTKARGKSGPLFVFEARDDIRIVQDASIEKEDSHAGKVLIVCILYFDFLIFRFVWEAGMNETSTFFLLVGGSHMIQLKTGISTQLPIKCPLKLLWNKVRVVFNHTLLCNIRIVFLHNFK